MSRLDIVPDVQSRVYDDAIMGRMRDRISPGMDVSQPSNMLTTATNVRPLPTPFNFNINDLLKQQNNQKLTTPEGESYKGLGNIASMLGQYYGSK